VQIQGDKAMADTPETLRDQWNRRYAESEHLWIHDPDPSLVELTKDLKPGRALDLGCGEGRNSVFLAEKGWSVTAVDISDVALSRLSNAAKDRGLDITVVCTDLNLFLGESGEFDLVVLANIHPSSNERYQLYKSLKKAVSQGGYIFIIGHHIDSLGHVGPPDPDRLLTESEIEQSFSEFEILELKKVSDVADHGHNSPSLVALLRSK
jgi:SAM-dependent methyltransferase